MSPSAMSVWLGCLAVLEASERRLRESLNLAKTSVAKSDPARKDGITDLLGFEAVDAAWAGVRQRAGTPPH